LSKLHFTVNKTYKDFWLDQERFVIAYGGAGSSKSWTTGQKLLTRLMSEENHRILVVRKVARTLRVSVFQLFKDLIGGLGIESSFKINKSDMTITYLPNGSELLFYGLDDIEKLKSIQGITSIWIEEASETNEGDIAELNRRLRGETPYYKQIIITFNPISHLHWLKSRFFDNENAKVSIYKTTYKDNKFIDEEYKQELEDIKNYDLQQYNIYALGEWGILNNNVVYHNYDFKKHTTTLTVHDFEVLHVGVDFNIGGCVGVVCGIRDNKVYVVDGWSVYDTDSIVTQLKQSKYNNKQLIVYPDASGGANKTNSSRSDIRIIMDGGFQIMANKANPAVRDRVNAVNRMFATDKILINDRAEKLVYSLQTQAYTPRGDPEKFTEHKGGAIDDWNDALGYLISYKFSINKSTLTRRSVSYA